MIRWRHTKQIDLEGLWIAIVFALWSKVWAKKIVQIMSLVYWPKWYLVILGRVCQLTSMRLGRSYNKLQKWQLRTKWLSMLWSKHRECSSKEFFNKYIKYTLIEWSNWFTRSLLLRFGRWAHTAVPLDLGLFNTISARPSRQSAKEYRPECVAPIQTELWTGVHNN